MNTHPRKPSYTSHGDFRLPMGFPPEGFISGLEYQAQPEDVFITTYPKCGTTWVQHIVWLIQNHGNPLPAQKSISEEIPHLEEAGKALVETLPRPRVIKTHLPYAMTPHHPAAKYIYVARNPYDCVVSFYYHTKGFVQHYDFADGTFDEFFECFITGDVDFGDYFDNLLGWYKNSDDRNILFLTYEQIKADTAKVVLRIAEFLGPRYLEQVKDKEILNRILDHCSFQKMSQDQNRWSSQRPDNMTPFIRRGEVGDWKNHFSSEQFQRLTEKLVTKTKGTKLASLWADLY